MCANNENTKTVSIDVKFNLLSLKKKILCIQFVHNFEQIHETTNIIDYIDTVGVKVLEIWTNDEGEADEKDAMA